MCFLHSLHSSSLQLRVDKSISTLWEARIFRGQEIQWAPDLWLETCPHLTASVFSEAERSGSLVFPSAHPQPHRGHLPLESQHILPKICWGGQITEIKSLQDGNPGFFIFNKAGMSWNLCFVCTVSSISPPAVRNPPTPRRMLRPRAVSVSSLLITSVIRARNRASKWCRDTSYFPQLAGSCCHVSLHPRAQREMTQPAGGALLTSQTPLFSLSPSTRPWMFLTV